MKDSTKTMLTEVREDLRKLHHRNHSADARRTAESIQQSKRDTINAILKKWKAFQPATKVQRLYAAEMIAAAEKELRQCII